MMIFILVKVYALMDGICRIMENGGNLWIMLKITVMKIQLHIVWRHITGTKIGKDSTVRTSLDSMLCLQVCMMAKNT